MSIEIARPNVRDQLLRLRDFQRDTVEFVFSRMYDPQQPAHRFLVADEVGLGKTFVARGLIAKIVDHLWDQKKRIDIIYICSNASIARQNINRLNITDANDVSLPSRITLLPTVIHGLEGRKLNLISLTPQTSFDLRSSLGTGEERALLYWLLPEDWKAQQVAVRNVLQGNVERSRFLERVKSFDTAGVDAGLKEKYRERLMAEPGIGLEFDTLCQRFSVFRQNLPMEDRRLQREMVGKLRLELAISCLDALEPDLIILDEFQRFKHLLDGTEQAADLANKLFTSNDARVLLLSATPYKMFTTSDEAGSDDHYRDFLQTVRFLYNDDSSSAVFKVLLSQYRDELMSVSGEDTTELHARKGALEQALRQVMVRTERLAVTADRNGMLSEVAPKSVELQTNDLSSYVAMARVARALKHSDVIEYWKSAPYLLNFMDDYELKRGFAATANSENPQPVIVEALASAPETLLSWTDIESYAQLDAGNARLRGLIADTMGEGMWQLLWLPPSLPYYAPAGPFGNRKPLTKRLVFSSWQVVPKVVASLLSYEAERHMFSTLTAGEERPNSQEAREKRHPLLRFSRSEGRLTGLPVFSLLYPSVTLAQGADPLSVLREFGVKDQLVTGSIVEHLRYRITELLKDLPEGENSGSVDERWYWAAPILLDMRFHPESTSSWFAQRLLPDVWRGEKSKLEPVPTTDEEDPESEGNEGWRDHVAEAQKLVRGRLPLGPRPPDLAEVLARSAIGSPATVALRALSRVCGGPKVLEKIPLRNEAAAIAWAFRSLFNLPEVTALIRGINDEQPYWSRVVQYCLDGCLQGVLDEFAHILLELEGVAYRPAAVAAKVIAQRMRDVLQLRTASLTLDIFDVDRQAQKITSLDRRMRARFAARFSAKQNDESAATLRQDDVRSAFNSPFWPFVLCTTTVGQEGLDFHPYCHAVVHWNLPSNPVDLEQREGRVHRYKGHAVRKNVATLYSAGVGADTHDDPWASMFRQAAASKKEGESDLIPYWLLPIENGATIERHVPALPLSRDATREVLLRRALVVYRLAFGQARQEDLVGYLQRRLPGGAINRVADELRIDLSPPKTRWVEIPSDADEIAFRSKETSDEDSWMVGPKDTGEVMLTADELAGLLERYADLALANSTGDDAATRYLELLNSFRERSAVL